MIAITVLSMEIDTSGKSPGEKKLVVDSIGEKMKQEDEENYLEF